MKMAHGDVMLMFQKMMILVALFSWLAIGFMIMVNFSQIVPFGWITKEMTTTYFTRSLLLCSAAMVLSFLAATKAA